MNPPAGAPTLTQGLIRLIRHKEVTADDLEKAALFTLDAVANAIAGCNTDAGRRLLAWGRGREADSGRRAFVMGALTHILEIDDVHRAAVVHTGCVTVPAAFALAMGREIAGELAALGFTGPPVILEGRAGFFAGACPDADPDAVLRDGEARWQLHETSIKPWPSCRHTHPVIDAALALAPEFDAAAVEEIEVTTYGAALDVCDRPVALSTYEAKFSLQHCMAAALQRGRIDFDAFDAAAREAAGPLARTIAVSSGEPYDGAYPKAWGGEVALLLTDGRRLTARREHCRGDPEAALDADEMCAKARNLLMYGGVDDAEPVIRATLAMAQGGEVPEISVFDGAGNGAHARKPGPAAAAE